MSSKQADPVIKAYQSGMNSKQMGMTFGMPRKDIENYLREHQVSKRPGRGRMSLKKLAKVHKFRCRARMLQQGSGWPGYKMNTWHERQLIFIKSMNRKYAAGLLQEVKNNGLSNKTRH